MHPLCGRVTPRVGWDYVSADSESATPLLDFLPHLDPPVRMATLSPTTLTADEQALILRVTATNIRDHTIISLALGTGLRLAEIVGLDVGDVFTPDGTPKLRVRVRKEIAKGGRTAAVFLPDRLVAPSRSPSWLPESSLGTHRTRPRV